MNSKKAKRIRHLVKHLQEKAAIADAPWAVPGYIEHKFNVPNPAAFKADAPDESIPKTIVEVHRQRVLDPKCGRAIYQQMKKRAVHHGRA
jgi:hypothetical protein